MTDFVACRWDECLCPFIIFLTTLWLFLCACTKDTSASIGFVQSSTSIMIMILVVHARKSNWELSFLDYYIQVLFVCSSVHEN